MPLTADEQAALDELVPRAEQTGDEYLDVRRAFDASRALRERNSRLGGIMIQVARRQHGGWQAAAEYLAEPATNLRRWSAPRPESEPT